MDKEHAENTLKNKLMEILEEELSALKLRGTRKENKDEDLINRLQDEKERLPEMKIAIDEDGNEYLIVGPPDGNEDVESKEKAFSPTDNTADKILLNTRSNRSAEVDNESIEEAFHLAAETVAGTMLKQARIYENQECVHKEKALKQPTDNASPKLLEESYDNQYEEHENVCNEKVFVSAAENTSILHQVCDHYGEEEGAHGEEIQTVDNAQSQIARQTLLSENGYMDVEENFHLPPDSIAEKILQQTEFYFEDYNLFKNSFLLNHVRRNKEGYVSLRLVSSFRKIKALTKDWKDVAYSLKKSRVLELNQEQNKIRRIEPIPNIEDTTFGKTVMVFNLPTQNSSSGYLRELFSKFGYVVSASVFENNSQNVDAYHKRCLYFHREIASKLYGIVEFETYDQAVNALRDEEGYLPKENEMLVVPLMPQIYKKQRRNLRFLRNYNPNSRRGYGRFRTRNEARYGEKPISSADSLRGGRMSTGYHYQRGGIRRFRGRKQFVPVSVPKYSDDQSASNFSGMRSNKWAESRRLKPNNNLNIDPFFTTAPRRRPGNAYVQAAIKA